MNLTIRTVCVLSVGLLCTLPSSVSAATLTEYSVGHADIGLAYEGGELELHYHFGSPASLNPASTEDEFHPSEAYVRVPDATADIVTPSGQTYYNTNLGLNLGDQFWVLPQSNTSGVPFLGFNAEELFGSPITSAQLEMTGFSGPGEFAMWQNGNSGPNTPVMRTNNGIGSDDLIGLSLSGHSHYNLGFTQKGVYDIDFKATGFGTGLPGGMVDDTETFRFVVGSLTAVPEPGSFVALASLGIVAAATRRRRRPMASTPSV